MTEEGHVALHINGTVQCTQCTSTAMPIKACSPLRTRGKSVHVLVRQGVRSRHNEVALQAQDSRHVLVVHAEVDGSVAYRLRPVVRKQVLQCKGGAVLFEKTVLNKTATSLPHLVVKEETSPRILRRREH